MSFGSFDSGSNTQPMAEINTTPLVAYNAFTRGNRLTMARLDGFAHDLHAYLTTGLRGRPGDKLVDIVAVRAGRSA